MNATLFDEFGVPELDAYPPLPATDPRFAEFFRMHNVVPPVMLDRCIGRSVWAKTSTDPQTCTGAYRTLIGVQVQACTESPRGGTVWIYVCAMTTAPNTTARAIPAATTSRCCGNRTGTPTQALPHPYPHAAVGAPTCVPGESGY